MIPKTKGLDKMEYVLERIFPEESIQADIEHLPEQIIASFNSFGIGTSICVDYKEGSNPMLILELYGEPQIKTAKVTNVKEEGENVIIEAVLKEKSKENKIKYVNKVINEIDFSQGLAKERLIEMLKNVFTP